MVIQIISRCLKISFQESPTIGSWIKIVKIDQQRQFQNSFRVIPAEAGIQNSLHFLDTGFLGCDGLGKF
jgi:hypothetical protein